jgi:hypothetical protein
MFCRKNTEKHSRQIHPGKRHDTKQHNGGQEEQEEYNSTPLDHAYCFIQ